MAHIGAIRLHVPGAGRVGHLQVHVLNQLLDLVWRSDADQGLHAPIQVAVHQVRRAYPDFWAGQRALANLWALGVGEGEDAAVLQETPQYGVDPDVLAQPRYSGLQGADTALDDVDLNPGLAGPVEGIDGFFINQGVDLDLDPGLFAVQGGLLFAGDALQESRPDGAGGHQEAMEGGLGGIPGELVEEPGKVLTHHGVAGQQAQIGVLTGGLRVVVACAHMAVTPQAVFLLTDHQGELAVGLESDDAVDHVDAGTLQLPGPGDVGLLVEPCLDLNQGQDLFACVGRIHQGVDDGGVARGAVEGLLDGQNLGVGRRLL